MAFSESRPIILLRGLLREKGHWGSFPQQLAHELPTRDVVCLDIPGNGGLFAETSPSSIIEMSLVLDKQLQTIAKQRCINLEEGIDIVAISMGGMMALEWAKQRPKFIRSLTLINTSIKGSAPFYLRLRYQNYLRILSFPFVNRFHKERLVMALTANLLDINKQKNTIKHWLDIANQHPVSFVNALRQLWAAARFSMYSAPIDNIHLISCINDKLVSSKCSECLALRWNVSHIQHASAGHDLALDDPKWLIEQLKLRFIR